ncbi:molybdenum cofactor guanylyltransferase [Euzebya sp.]|uniref:molybdenum cofactor guanylyltransferase n=1 Tax=Euzebya sp. TaxID=1971409 RepID=UPI003515151A
MTVGTAGISGVVLAGGASRRMGRDKALIPVDGARLVDRAVRCLRQVADDVVVASGPRRIPDVAVPQVPDRPADVGPLGGLVAGLVAVEHDLAAVLAVDLADPDPGLLGALADRWAGEPALIPSADGRPQPLHAVWAATAAMGLAVLVADGVRSVARAAEALGATVLDEATSSALSGHARWARNLNRPEDLRG